MAVAYKTIASYPDMRQNVVDVTLDASYPANGYVLTAAGLGMLSVDSVVPVVSTTEAVTSQYIAASAKLKLLKTGSATSGVLLEIANTDVSATTKVRCNVTGTPVL